MLIETTFENRSRFNWTQAEVLRLPGELARVHIPTEFYNPPQSIIEPPHTIEVQYDVADDADDADASLFVEGGFEWNEDDIVAANAAQQEPTGSATNTPLARVDPVDTQASPDTPRATPVAVATPTTAIRRPQLRLTHDQLTRLAQDKYPFEECMLEIIDRYTEWLGKSCVGSEATTWATPRLHGHPDQTELVSIQDIWSIVGRRIGHDPSVHKDDDLGPIGDWASSDLINLIVAIQHEHVLPGCQLEGAWSPDNLYAITMFLGQEERLPGQKEFDTSHKSGPGSAAYDALRKVLFENQKRMNAMSEWEQAKIIDPDLSKPPEPEWALPSMPGNTNALVLIWPMAEKHWIVVRYTRVDKAKGTIEYWDSDEKQEEREKSNFGPRKQWHLKALPKFGDLLSQNPNHAWHNVEWGAPISMPCTLQYGGDCGFHVLHNRLLLLLGEPMTIQASPDNDIERIEFGVKLRWDALKTLYNYITGKDAEAIKHRQDVTEQAPLKRVAPSSSQHQPQTTLSVAKRRKVDKTLRPVGPPVSTPTLRNTSTSKTKDVSTTVTPTPALISKRTTGSASELSATGAIGDGTRPTRLWSQVLADPPPEPTEQESKTKKTYSKLDTTSKKASTSHDSQQKRIHTQIRAPLPLPEQEKSSTSKDIVPSELERPTVQKQQPATIAISSDPSSSQYSESDNGDTIMRDAPVVTRPEPTSVEKSIAATTINARQQCVDWFDDTTRRLAKMYSELPKGADVNVAQVRAMLQKLLNIQSELLRNDSDIEKKPDGRYFIELVNTHEVEQLIKKVEKSMGSIV